ncbi:MAG: 4Fe-4S dicluster domain-containing protein [Bacteroides sp.]|nr:4Fe-4S dicluster domain-containing protein [Bacteroides sp.]
MDFGFGIAPSSAVNLDKVDLGKFERLHELEPDVYKCMQCGSCSATCIAGRFSGMSVRKVLHALQRGKEKDAIAMVKGCMLCGKCSMVCPRGINTRHVILGICRIYGEEAR